MVDLLEDANGNVLDLIEDTAGADDFSVSTNSIVVAKGGVAPDIQIFGATGAVTASASNAKITATLSGDYDTVIISAAADATAGAYTVTITDSASNSAVIDVTVPA